MNIGIIGCGFVGLANATLLAHNNKVLLWDVSEERLELISNKVIPFDDNSIAEEWHQDRCDFEICDSKKKLIISSDIIILALPTDLNQYSNELDVHIIEETISDILEYRSDVLILIRSTVNVGFTQRMQKEFEYERIIFMPEFLREGMAYTDILNPDRIVIGGEVNIASIILGVFKESIKQAGGGENIQINIVSTSEAEAIKLFSNTYLAMRVAFFNEVDIFSENNELNGKKIIKAICEDYRIGKYYCNPSFGYGGYCLPKDVKQAAILLGNDGVLIKAIDSSNENRKLRIVNNLCSFDGNIGIYRLQAKKDAKNIRYSVMLDIVSKLIQNGKKIYVYEPLLMDAINVDHLILVDSIKELADKCDLIVANTFAEELIPYKNKLYTRDLEVYDN